MFPARMKRFWKAWRNHLVFGFQAALAGIAVGILYQLFLFVVLGIERWLFPGMFGQVPENLKTVGTVSFFILVLLPLYGFLLSQMMGAGRSISTARGEVREGIWRRRRGVPERPDP